MRVLLLLALVACGEGDGALYPINPGGTGPGGSQGGADAAVDGNDGGGSQLAGRVCLISDARDPTTCATTGADGLTVSLDGNTATTIADGTFAIDPPTSSIIQWRVEGTGVIPSIMSYSAARIIPVMVDADYFDLTSSNGIVPGTVDQGDVFIRVTHAGMPDEQVAATTAPAAAYATLYDGNAPTTWTQLGTGPLGMVWIPGLPKGTVTVMLTPLGGTATPVPTIPVGDQTLTWVTVALP